MTHLTFCEFQMSPEELCFIDRWLKQLNRLSSEIDAATTDAQSQFHELFSRPLSDISLDDCSNLQENAWFKYKRNLCVNSWSQFDHTLPHSNMLEIFATEDRPLNTKKFLLSNNDLLKRISSLTPFEPHDITFCEDKVRQQFCNRLDELFEMRETFDELAGDNISSSPNSWGSDLCMNIYTFMDVWLQTSGFMTAFFVDVIQSRRAQ